MLPLKKIKFLVIHHSQNQKTPESIKNLHIKEYGWEDIGYHWIINKNGKLLKGRNEKFRGAHVYGFNEESLGICLIGNFDKEKPTEEQMQALFQFLKQKIKTHKIPVKNILGHRECPNAAKTCPGKFIDVGEIRNILAN